MDMTDWRRFAENQGLTVEEFKKEIFTAACAVAAIDLDGQEDGTALRFTCNDGSGDLELYVRRKL